MQLKYKRKFWTLAGDTFFTLCIFQESEVCHFVLIAGQPLNQPVVQYGM